MKITDFSIAKPVTVIVGVILILIFGIIGLMRIPIQLTPNVEKPVITIATYWPGGSPVEVEREIVEVQEDRLKGIQGMTDMASQSRSGSASITLTFDINTDMDAALLKVSNRLQQVYKYPDGALRPILSRSGDSKGGMAWCILRPLSGDVLSVKNELDFANDYIKPRLESVPGVSVVNVYGGLSREMQIIVDPDKLAARDITPQEVMRAISLGNKNTSAGEFDEGKRRYIVRIEGEYTKIEDLENIILKQIGNEILYIGDVAKVQLGYKKPTFITRNKDIEPILFRVVRETGSNMLAVQAALTEAIENLNKSGLGDRNLTIVQTSDQTTYIRSAIKLVKNNLLVGGFLSVLVLLIFLRSVTSTIIIATSIPISLIGTFFLMYLFGRNINVISLAGMAFAVGIVVDAAIVVLENIYRHREDGEDKKTAAKKGASEVWGAILASSLTTVAVFAPIIFMKEEAGQLFRDIALAISAAVLLSLIVSITVIPTLASKFLGGKKFEKNGTNKKTNALLKPAASVVNSLTSLTYWISGRIHVQILVVVLLTGAAIGISLPLIPELEYLPTGNRDSISGFVMPPPGYNLAQAEVIAELLTEELSPYWTAELGSPEAAQLKYPLIKSMFFYAGTTWAFMGISPYPEEANRIKELIPLLKNTLSTLPGYNSFAYQPGLFSRGIGGGKSIDVQIIGPELDKIMSMGKGMYMQLMGLLPGSQIRPNPGLTQGNPEVRITPDRVRAAEAGINVSELGFMVDMFLDGVKVSDYQHEGRKIDIRVMGEPGQISRTQDLSQIPLRTPTRKLITLGSVASIKTVAGPVQINHINRKRAITLQVILASNITLQSAMEKITEKVIKPMKEKGTIGGLYSIRLAGTADKLTQTKKALTFNFALALLITFLLMSALFESFVYPLVIMFSVPLAGAGGFLGLAVINIFYTQPFDILTLLGFVILLGIVVNNAILIVHQGLNNIRQGGMEPRLAVAESVRTRLRPIFMSATTSVLGMMPLVIFPGAGSELYRGIGGVVIGGLIVSTVFTVFLVPSLFSLVLKIQGFFGVAPKFIHDEKAEVEREVGLG